MSASRRSFPIYVVDAFTAPTFRGNPAAVCWLSEFLPDSALQEVAAEFNLSETAFVVPREGHCDLRWFTPTVEVDLCGHATLAAAHALWDSERLAVSEIAEFQTRSGRLTAVRTAQEIRLDFPASPVTACAPPPGLLDALGVRPRFVGQTAFDFLVEVASEQEVRTVSVDFGGLRRLGVRGVILTAPASDPRFDIVSRFFAPGAGIDEDPVTGSAHCALATFWSARLPRRNTDGLPEFRAWQASPRGGVLRVVLCGERVHLFGQATTVIRGEFRLDGLSARTNLEAVSTSP